MRETLIIAAARDKVKSNLRSSCFDVIVSLHALQFTHCFFFLKQWLSSKLRRVPYRVGSCRNKKVLRKKGNCVTLLNPALANSIQADRDERWRYSQFLSLLHGHCVCTLSIKSSSSGDDRRGRSSIDDHQHCAHRSLNVLCFCCCCCYLIWRIVILWTRHDANNL